MEISQFAGEDLPKIRLQPLLKFAIADFGCFTMLRSFILNLGCGFMNEEDRQWIRCRRDGPDDFWNDWKSFFETPDNPFPNLEKLHLDFSDWFLDGTDKSQIRLHSPDIFKMMLTRLTSFTGSTVLDKPSPIRRSRYSSPCRDQEPVEPS